MLGAFRASAKLCQCDELLTIIEMNSAIGNRTPPPRLVDIKSPRPQSMGTPLSINPRLLSRRQTSRSHNHGSIDTVPELRRFNSSGTKSSVKMTPHQTTSQSYGSSDTIPPRRERETMKDLSDFLMSYDPPAHNLVAPPQATPRKKFGLLRRKQKREPKSNQFLKLPDTAIAAKTRQGVQYIAISIPLEHDYLGRMPTPTEPGSNSERAPTLDRLPVVVYKPVYNAGHSMTPSPDSPVLERKTSISKRSTWGPGTLTKVITKPGSEEIVLQNGYIQRTSQVYTPTESLYHDALETRPRPHSSKTIPSPGPPLKVSLTGNCRVNSLSSVSRPILWRHRSDGPLRVINRTPSPDFKPTYQTHKIVKSISTIRSVATSGTGIGQSLKSTPDSINTNSSMPAVFGTAETIDLQSFTGTTPRPSLASPQSEKIVQFPTIGSEEPGNGRVNQATSPTTISFPQSPQSGSNEKQGDQATQTSRREKVRARKERDLASLRSRNSNLDKIATHEISTQSISEKSPKTEFRPSSPSSPNSKSIEPAARSAERLLQKAVVLSTSNIMLVADIPPSVNHVHQSDISLPRPLSPVPPIPSLSRLPRPKFILSRPLQSLDKGNSTYTHHSTQTILAHTFPSPQLQKARYARLSSEPFVYPQLDQAANGYNLDGLDIDMDTVREREIGPRGSRERELDVRMRIIERDTDILLRTLGGIVKSFDGLGEVARLRWEGVNGRDRGVRSSVIGINGVTGKESNGKMFGFGESNEGNRRRAATTGMEMGMGMEDRDMDLVMREIRGAAPRVSDESLRVRGREVEGDGFAAFL